MPAVWTARDAHSSHSVHYNNTKGLYNIHRDSAGSGPVCLTLTRAWTRRTDTNTHLELQTRRKLDRRTWGIGQGLGTELDLSEAAQGTVIGDRCPRLDTTATTTEEDNSTPSSPPLITITTPSPSELLHPLRPR